MGAVTIQQMADRVAALMEERLGAKGTTLAQKLRRGGRHMHRKVRRQAHYLAKSSVMAQNPKLLMQVDEEKVAQAYDACIRHLNGVSLWHKRKGVLIGIGASVLGSLLVVGVLLIAVLAWRGYL
jgi:hypothetical protein